MALSNAELAERLAPYLSERWPEARDLRVTEVARIPGGASRETYRVSVEYGTGDGDVSKGLIIRRDPVSSLIETERSAEFYAYRAAWEADGIPVPEPLFLEEDPRWLDQPFTVMDLIPDCQTSAQQIPEDQRERVGRQKWTILGRLASIDPAETVLADHMEMPALEECALREVARWEQMINEDELGPQPIVRAAIRWLRRHPPPPAQKLAIVHGDYRSGNFLFDDEGEIKGILDWEMCHLGDPLEDLAWSFDPLWAWGQPDLAGHLLPRGRAMAIWEEASGLKVDLDAFRWWEVFASVKAMAIWVSSCEDFAHGESGNPILAFAGIAMGDRQNRILVDRLSPNSTGRYVGRPIVRAGEEAT